MTIRRFVTGAEPVESVELDSLTESEQSRILEEIFAQAAVRLGYTPVAEPGRKSAGKQRQ